jgi:hypothetical protein
MPSFMITFRPHPLEPSVLDTFLTLFFGSDLFTTSKEYKYNIEKDGTPDRHFHIFITTTIRDKEKLYKYFQVKEFKQFKEWICKKETEFQHGLNIILVSDKLYRRNDRLYRIGYVSKDKPSPYNDILTTNMDSALIKQGLDYMIEYDRIHTQKKDYSKDIKSLTMKTVLPEVMYYHEEKDIPLDLEIFDKMNEDGVFTINLTDAQEEKVIRQLCIYYGYKFKKKPFDSTIQPTFKQFCEEPPVHKIDCGYTLIYGEKKCNKCLEVFPCEKHKEGGT